MSHRTDSRPSENPSLGSARGVYRVKPRLAWRLLLIFAALMFFGIAVISVFAIPQISSILLCSLPMLLLGGVFVKMLRDAIVTAGDELEVYEYGFVYRSGGKVQSCRWDEVREIRRHPRMRELMWVEKQNREMITFADDPLPGKESIIEAFDAFVLDPKNRERMGSEWDDYRAEISRTE